MLSLKLQPAAAAALLADGSDTAGDTAAVFGGADAKTKLAVLHTE
jgi:hypothetical protein